MKKAIFITFVLTFIAASGNADKALSQPYHHEGMEKAPYGDYCPGYKKQWYGAKIAVKTKEEARKILQEYFAGYKVTIGSITERKWFFKAEIFDKNDKLVDVVIVDKRTGRIRSIY